MTDNEIGGLETEMNRGFVQILALALLERDMYGYAMAKRMETLGYPVEENTLYPLLRRLEKNGWIAGRWEMGGERPRKVYGLTPAGRTVRGELVAFWRKQVRVLDELVKETTHD